jgi:hypothetical protein
MPAVTSGKGRKVLKWVGTAIALGVALYVALYLWAAHSEAFAFAERAIRSSPSIAERVGMIERVSLDPRGPLDEYYVGSNVTASMVVDVAGEKGKTEIRVDLRKMSGVWEITGATVEGLPISLK